MAELLAPAGSMIDSVILVTVRSRFAGRKALTPDRAFSKCVLIPEDCRVVVRREEMDEKPRKRSGVVEEVEVVGVGEEVSIVMRVVARTLGGILEGVCLGMDEGRGRTV